MCIEGSDTVDRVEANLAIAVLNPQTVWPVDTKGPVKDRLNEKLLNPNSVSKGFRTALNSFIKAISKIDKKCKT